ncbi:MAG: YfhO family protein [Planctomycetes bacterium]|nr:YfhO family protein [Planctomycetota bacterium]
MPAGSYEPPPGREQLQAVLLAALCALVFLGRAVLPDRALVPFPIEAMEPWSAEAAARVPPGEAVLRGNPTMGDKYNQSLAWDRILGDALADGRVPAWTRDLAGGAAFVPQMAQVYQPWNLLLLLVPAPGCYGPWFFLHLVLLGWLGYRFLRQIGVHHLAGLLGVVTLVLGFWVQARVHHNVILTAALSLFPMLGAVHRIVLQGGGATSVAALGLWTGLSWLAGFAPVALQASLVAAAYAVLCLLQADRATRGAALARCSVGFALGALLAAAQMVPVLLAAEESSRRAADAAALRFHSLQLCHLLNGVWPTLVHWPAEVFYGSLDQIRPSWPALLLGEVEHTPSGVVPKIVAARPNFPETAFGVGGLGLVAAALALGHRTQRRTTLFFLGLLAVGVGIALCLPGFLQLTALLPGARAGDLKRFLFLPGMALPVLAALGLDHRLSAGRGRAGLCVAAVLAATSGGLLAVHLAPAASLQEVYATWTAPRYGLEPAAYHAAVSPGEAEANRARALFAFAGGLCAGLAALALLLTRHREPAARAWILLGAVELAALGKGTVVDIATTRVTTPPTVLAPALEATRAAEAAGQPRPRFQRIASTPDESRLTPLLPQNLAAFLGLEDLASYHPLPPRRQEEFFACVEPGLALHGIGVNYLRHPESLGHPLLDLMGLAYVLAGRSLADPGLADCTPPGSPGPYRLYRRSSALPRATFVTRAVVLADPAARLRHLARRDHDPAREVVLEDPTAPGADQGDAPAATVRCVRHEEECVELAVQAPASGYLRLADPYDAGWTATVDGADTPIYVADHYLRAVHVPAGAHTVRFAYDGARVVWPRRLSLLALGLIAALFAAGRFARRRA